MNEPDKCELERQNWLHNYPATYTTIELDQELIEAIRSVSRPSFLDHMMRSLGIPARYFRGDAHV